MAREIEYSLQAKEDLVFFEKTGQNQIRKRIRLLIEDIKENPFTGIGKPEPLKHQLSGFWSRRINKKHRLVYAVTEKTVFILSLADHY